MIKLLRQAFDRSEDIVVPAFALTGASALVAFTLKMGLFLDGEPSPWFAAFASAVVLASVSMVMIAAVLIRRTAPAATPRKETGSETGMLSRRNLYVASFVVCCVSIELASIYLAIPVTLVFLLRFAERRSWATSLLMAAASVIFLELVFYRMLSVELEPGGIVGYLRRLAGLGY